MLLAISFEERLNINTGIYRVIVEARGDTERDHSMNYNDEGNIAKC